MTQYVNVPLNVPVCNSCLNVRPKYYIGAAVAFSIGFIAIQLKSLPEQLSVPVFSLGFGLALILAILGVRATPIKVLKVDRKDGTVRLALKNEKFALEMAGLSEGSVSDLPLLSKGLKLTLMIFGGFIVLRIILALINHK